MKILNEASSAGDHACQVTEIVIDGFFSPCRTCIPGWSGDWLFQAPTAISQGQEGWGSLQTVARACSGISALPFRQLKLSLSRISRPKCWLTIHGAWGHEAHVICQKLSSSQQDWPLQGKHEVLRLRTVHSSAHGRLQLPLLACAGASEKRHEGTYHVQVTFRSPVLMLPFLCRKWRTADGRKKSCFPHRKTWE